MRSFKFLIILSFLINLVSCGIHIQKRVHQKGFYVSHKNGIPDNVTKDSVVEETESLSQVHTKNLKENSSNEKKEVVIVKSSKETSIYTASNYSTVQDNITEIESEVFTEEYDYAETEDDLTNYSNSNKLKPKEINSIDFGLIGRILFITFIATVFISFILGITILTGVVYPEGFVLAILIGGWFAGVLALISHIISLMTGGDGIESVLSIFGLISALLIVGLIILLALA